jgi:hypothetical protein
MEALLGWDSVFTFFSECGVAVEGVLILLMVRVRLFRAFPAFLIWVCWSFVNDIYFLAINYQNYQAPLRTFEIETAVDSILMFAVLVELAWSVLRPIRSSLPRYSWLVIVGLILVAGGVVWFIAGLTVPGYLTSEGQVFFRLQQTGAILRVVVFLAMAGFSQLLSIGWRNRELQIATGFGFYSIVSLAVTILHTHQLSTSPQYHWLDEAVAVSYILALTYWVFAFATREAERREFTPQMQSFLLAAAGSARAARIGMADSSSVNSRKNNE